MLVILPEETRHFDNHYQRSDYHPLQVRAMLAGVVTERNELLVEAGANSEGDDSNAVVQVLEHLVFVVVELLAPEDDRMAEDYPLCERNRLLVVVLAGSLEHQARQILIDVKFLVVDCGLLECLPVSLHGPWILLGIARSALGTLLDFGCYLL